MGQRGKDSDDAQQQEPNDRPDPPEDHVTIVDFRKTDPDEATES